jgi:putative hydrolase of the HAD superfamily
MIKGRFRNWTTMMNDVSGNIKAIFLDVGGVLLTNGWDHYARARAIARFNLDVDETQERHHLTFDTYEEGKLSLDDYLKRVVFYQPRDFTIAEFKDFMFKQSQPHDDMIGLICGLREKYRLRTVAVSNEGRELTEYRIREFKLYEFIDAFVSSSFVHYRKPDEDIFRIALDISLTPRDAVVYLDDRAMFVEIARGFGIRGIVHESYEKSRKALEKMGLIL